MAKMNRLANVHPGEVLVEEFLEPMGITQYQLAKEIHVPLTRIAMICRRRRSITADTALRLAKFFGTSPRFWLGLQEDFDLEKEAQSKIAELATIRLFHPVSV